MSQDAGAPLSEQAVPCEAPEEALQFIRDGLGHAVKLIHGEVQIDEQSAESLHVDGRQLCEGLRDLAIKRYGLMARTVLERWGIRRTDDFGTLVYELINRGELRSSPADSFDHFQRVYSFDEAFGGNLVS